MPGNLPNLQKATAARTAAATARAEAALTAMIKAGEPVTFRGLAAHAGVSLDFLYRNTAVLRQALEQAHGENLLLRRRLAAGRDPAPGQ